MKKAKLTAALAALFLLNVLLISLSQQADAVAYKQGSSGSINIVFHAQQKSGNVHYF